MAQRVGKVFVVALIPPAQTNMLKSPADLIRDAIRPGAHVTRYGREWIIGRTIDADGALRGRIGFRGAEGLAEVWDEDRQDFTQIAVPAGLTAPFAIDLAGLRMAVQTRGSDIKLTGLLGAFQALLSSDAERWTIRGLRREMTFSEWRATVERVTSARFRIRRPNPHYQGTPNLESLLEQAEAEVALLELSSPDGIDTASPFVAESQAHIEAGYGDAVFHGVRPGVSDARESVYSTVYRSEEIAHEAPVNEEGEVSQESLSEALSRDAEPVETGGDDRES